MNFWPRVMDPPRYLGDFLDRYPKEKKLFLKKDKKLPLKKRTIKSEASDCHSISRYLVPSDPLLLMADEIVEPVVTRLEGQVEDHHDCDIDNEHKTECFAANSGKLYWRCLVCKQTSGPFAGYPKLIGADGELSKKRRIAPTLVSEVDQPPTGPSTSGVHPFSLESLAADLKSIRVGQERLQISIEALIGSVYNLDDPTVKKRFESLSGRMIN